MDYTSYVASLTTMMAEQDPADPNFQAILPDIIAYAEGRIYRDIDMVGTRFIADTPLLELDRTFALPLQTVIVEGITVLAGANNRIQMVPVSREYLEWAWPNSTAAAAPQYFAITGQLTGLVGPWPDTGYTLTVRGVQTPTPLAANNPNTLLTLYLPDLFLAASMVQASGYQKNFGGQSDDPQQAMSWEGQYNNLLKQATIFEFRKKFQSESWSSQPMNPVVQPPRA